MACSSGPAPTPQLADDFTVNEAGEILMSGSAIRALGLPSSVTDKLKRVRKADQDSERDVQMHLVPKDIINKFIPSLAALQAQYDQETKQGQNTPVLYLGGSSSNHNPAMPSASGPPVALRPPADHRATTPVPREQPSEVEALREVCAEQSKMIAELLKNQEPQELPAQRRSGPAASGSSSPSCTPEGTLKLQPVPAAAVPKMRSKAPKAPAPQTGCAARRTVILPPLSRLNRAQLENLAAPWEVDPRGKTVAQIRGALYELDKDMREGRRAVPGKST